MKKGIALLLILLLATGGVMLLKKRKNQLASAPPAPVRKVVVRTVALQPGAVTLTRPAMGIVESDISSMLSTRINGRVMEVLCQAGDSVQKNDLLATIDVSDLQAKKRGLTRQREAITFQIKSKNSEIRALQTSLEAAQETHARTKELLEVKGASAEQFSQEEARIATIEASISGARNGIETLKQNMQALQASMAELDTLIGYGELRAPTDGTVAEILTSPGDLATPGKPLLRIASNAGLFLSLSLPDSLRPQEILVENQFVKLSPKHQSSPTGLIQYVAPLPKLDGLTEGQFLNIGVVTYRGQGILVPVDCLLTLDGHSFIILVDTEGRANKKAVTIVARGVEGVVIAEQIEDGRAVIAKPDILLRITAGTPIAPINTVKG